jgi:tetratricopeptide (TPR) repeat protein
MSDTIWTTLVSEAERFRRQTHYKQAERVYTRALGLHPTPALYIARSQCRLLHGDADGALHDADKVLELEATNIKAMLCKAEALYALGDFETSMVWFARGNHQRPELPEFPLGIEKCYDAIQKAIQKFEPTLVKKFRERVKEDVFFRIHHAKMKHGEHVLEELAEDYQFLKSLREGESPQVSEEAERALEYLDTRIEFWRARDPRTVV